MARTILMRSDSGTNWGSVNPILGVGEIGFDTTVKQFKVGDGSTAWASLKFVTLEDASTAVSVTTLATILDGYQVEGSYAASSHTHAGVYQPVGTYMVDSIVDGYSVVDGGTSATRLDLV